MGPTRGVTALTVKGPGAKLPGLSLFTVRVTHSFRGAIRAATAAALARFLPPVQVYQDPGDRSGQHGHDHDVAPVFIEKLHHNVYTFPAATLRMPAPSDTLDAGLNSRYNSPANSSTATTVNTLKDTIPVNTPPN